MSATEAMVHAETSEPMAHLDEKHRDTDPPLSIDSVYDAHFDFVWRSLRRLGVAEASLDDAAQDVFVVVHRQLRRFEGRSSLKTWLFAITFRVARDYRRSLRRRGTEEAIDETTTVSSRPSPLEHAERAEAARLLHRFLDSLDEDKRAVFILAELEQMTAPEIAQALDANVNTVYARLRKARHRFVEMVRGERAKNGSVVDD